MFPDGSAAQWASNFDVGFDIASNMVKEKLEAYLSKNKIAKNSNTVLVFTGHSRGAAIANILGAEYELEGKCKTFTYGFAVPATTTDATTATSVETVFNIINTDDIVTAMPLASWDFVRYGKDKCGRILCNRLADKVRCQQIYFCKCTGCCCRRRLPLRFL